MTASVTRTEDEVGLVELVRLAYAAHAARLGLAHVPLRALHTLAEGDEVDRAVEVARSIDWDEKRALALAEVAEHASGGRVVDRALEFARSNDQGRALARIASFRGSSDLLSEAAQMAEAADDAFDTSLALNRIVAEIADPELASQALEIAETIVVPHLRDLALTSIFERAIEAGSGDALGVARSISDPIGRSKCLAQVIERMVSHGATIATSDTGTETAASPHLFDVVDEVIEFVRAIDDPASQVLALVEVAGRVGDNDGGRALRMVHAIDDLRDRYFAMVDVAIASGNIELANDALDLADRIGGEYGDEAMVGVALSTARHDLGRALEAADLIGDPYTRWNAMAEIARLVANSDPRHAIEIARSIGSPSDRSEVLAEIIERFDEADLGDALIVARSIDHPHYRSEALASVAYRSGDLSLADEAIGAARLLDDNWNLQYALAGIARMIADSYPDRALDIARSIGALPLRAEVTAELATRKQSIDLAQEARRIANSIGEPATRSEAIEEVAAHVVPIDPGLADEIALDLRDLDVNLHAVYLMLGRMAEVDPTRAIAFARSAEDRHLLCFTLVEASVHTNNPDLATEAIDIAHAIDDVRRTSGVLAEIAERLVETDTDRALQIARTIETHRDRSGTLARIAASTKNAALMRDAIEAAQHIDDEDERFDQLGFVAANAAEFDPPLGFEILRSIHPDHQAVALERVAELIIDADQLAKTVDIARSIDDVDDRSGTLARIASFTAKFDHDRALAIADMVDLQHDRSIARVQIAEQVIGIDPDRALDLARAFNSPEDQAVLLAKIAARTASTAPMKEAVAIASEITSSDARDAALSLIAVQVSTLLDDPTELDELVAVVQQATGATS